MLLSDADIRRYSRQLLLPELGGREQRGLAAATVRVTGDARVASVCLLYLAAAGVGTIVADLDGERARALNPAVHIEPIAKGPVDLSIAAAAAESVPEAYVEGSLLAVTALRTLLARPPTASGGAR